MILRDRRTFHPILLVWVANTLPHPHNVVYLDDAMKHLTTGLAYYLSEACRKHCWRWGSIQLCYRRPSRVIAIRITGMVPIPVEKRMTTSKLLA
jgi:hypothetical protein